MKGGGLLFAGVGALLALSMFNLFTSIRHLGKIREAASHGEPEYTYVGSDYPPLMPLPSPLTRAPYTFENTSHFPISGPGAVAEWSTIYPPGYGFVRLGAPRRILCVSMFHQLHCVEKLRLALNDPDDPVATILHLQHCLNYLRQMVLCGGDLTLEPVDTPPEGWKGDEADWEMRGESSGAEVEHQCWDWGLVYETLGENYARWLEYWEAVKDTVPNE